MTNVIEDLKQHQRKALDSLSQQRTLVEVASDELARHDEIWRSYEARCAEIPKYVIEARRAAYQACATANSPLAALERVAREAERELRNAEKWTLEQAARAKGEAEYQQELAEAKTLLLQCRKQAAKLEQKHEQARRRVEDARKSITAVAESGEALSVLQAMRTGRLGEAYLQSEVADTGTIDEQIADMKLRMHAAQVEAEGVNAALPTLERQVEEVRDALAEQVQRQKSAESSCRAAEAALIEHGIRQQVERLGATLKALEAVAAGQATRLQDCWKRHGMFVPGPGGLELPAWLNS